MSNKTQASRNIPVVRIPTFLVGGFTLASVRIEFHRRDLAREVDQLRADNAHLRDALYKITKVEAGTVMTSLSMRTIARAALEANGDKK